MNHIKLINDYSYRWRDPVFFETGSGEGGTTQAVVELNRFKWHFTTEIDEHQYWKTLETTMWLPNVTAIHGASEDVLPRILPHLRDSGIVFWLDAHYNEGHKIGGQVCPIMDELGSIQALHPDNNLILIDDVHLFGVDPAYPTPEDVGRWVKYFGYDIYRMGNIYCIGKDLNEH